MCDRRHAVAHVGATGTDADRDRWLAARLWLQHVDAELDRELGTAGDAREDCIDLSTAPRRDFLLEEERYDVVITHNLWGFPELVASVPGAATACSPQHAPAAWRSRLKRSGARYIFLFGPHFNAAYFDRLIPGYDCIEVAAASFLSVFVERSFSARAHAVPERAIGYRDMTRARLENMTSLTANQALDLSYTEFEGRHASALGCMTRLSDLSLAGTAIADADLEIVAGRRALERLNLDATAITSSGLRHLESLTKLECLSLNDTQIDDAGLVHLRAMQRLDWLSLSGTRVSDRGLCHLESIASLRYLSLVRTHASDSGVARLQKSLPECAICIGAQAGQ